VLVPECAESATLYFWHYMISNDSTTQAYDFLYFGIYDITAGTSVHLSAINNATLPRNNWLPTSRVIAPDATEFRGHRLGLAINGVTDESLPTIWYVDNVQLIFDCAACP